MWKIWLLFDPRRALVALFAFVFLGERPSATGWLGIALIAAGAVLLAVKK